MRHNYPLSIQKWMICYAQGTLEGTRYRLNIFDFCI